MAWVRRDGQRGRCQLIPVTPPHRAMIDARRTTAAGA
jgi:hypothetical protein